MAQLHLQPCLLKDNAQDVDDEGMEHCDGRSYMLMSG
jgi:hypothetical protein